MGSAQAKAILSQKVTETGTFRESYEDFLQKIRVFVVSTANVVHLGPGVQSRATASFIKNLD